MESASAEVVYVVCGLGERNWGYDTHTPLAENQGERECGWGSSVEAEAERTRSQKSVWMRSCKRKDRQSKSCIKHRRQLRCTAKPGRSPRESAVKRYLVSIQAVAEMVWRAAKKADEQRRLIPASTAAVLKSSSSSSSLHWCQAVMPSSRSRTAHRSQRERGCHCHLRPPTLSIPASPM